MLQDCYFIMFKIFNKLFLKLYAKFCSLESKYNNRLKRAEPHNIPTYKAEMTCHIELHEDVLGRLLTNLKQDDYFRSLEDLPTIDGLQAYDDVRLFPELYDTTAVIE